MPGLGLELSLGPGLGSGLEFGLGLGLGLGLGPGLRLSLGLGLGPGEQASARCVSARATRGHHLSACCLKRESDAVFPV